MKHMSVVVHQLKKEREHAQKQLKRLDAALEALGSVSSNGASRISAAGRRRISLAQKERWAKQKAVTPKRTISTAGRRRRAAAQRARWAKFKSRKAA
jgi:chromosome segregation ATPase